MSCGSFFTFCQLFLHDCKIRIFFEIFFQTITFSKTLWHKNGIKKKGRSFSNSVCHKNGDFFPFAISSFSSLFSQRIQNFFRIFAKNENAKKLASVLANRKRKTRKKSTYYYISTAVWRLRRKKECQRPFFRVSFFCVFRTSVSIPVLSNFLQFQFSSFLSFWSNCSKIDPP